MMTFKDSLEAAGLTTSSTAEFFGVPKSTARALCNGEFLPTPEQEGMVVQLLEDMAYLKSAMVAYDLPVIPTASYNKLALDIQSEST